MGACLRLGSHTRIYGLYEMALHERALRLSHTRPTHATRVSFVWRVTESGRCASRAPRVARPRPRGVAGRGHVSRKAACDFWGRAHRGCGESAPLSARGRHRVPISPARRHSRPRAPGTSWRRHERMPPRRPRPSRPQRRPEAGTQKKEVKEREDEKKRVEEQQGRAAGVEDKGE